MLVLARKSKEIIRIGENITVKVLSIRNGQVKLGIEAPKELRVTREGREEEPPRGNGGGGGESGTNGPGQEEGDDARTQ